MRRGLNYAELARRKAVAGPSRNHRDRKLSAVAVALSVEGRRKEPANLSSPTWDRGAVALHCLVRSRLRMRSANFLQRLAKLRQQLGTAISAHDDCSVLHQNHSNAR